MSRESLDTLLQAQTDLDNAQGGPAAQPTDVPPAPPVDGPTPVDGPQAPPPHAPPPHAPPPQVYRSPAERYAARDAAADANTQVSQRIAQETLNLKKTEAEARERRRTQPTPQIAAKNREKLQTFDIIDARLDDVEAAFMGPKNPDGTRKPGGIEGSFSVGLVGGYLPSEGGRGYDATVDALRPFLRQISRTPGEGTMSDYETRQAEALLPSRNDHESVIKQKILQIRNIIKQSRSGMTAPAAPAGAGPTAPARTPVKVAPAKEFDSLPMPPELPGKRMKFPDGSVRRSNGRDWVRE